MATRQLIMVIDNDASVADKISLYLTRELYDTCVEPDPKKAFDRLSECSLVILCLDSVSMDSYRICRQIRTVSHVPIIILSHKGDVVDKVLGLEMGADDYMVAPVDLNELVARVRALLRRSEPGYYANTAMNPNSNISESAAKGAKICTDPQKLDSRSNDWRSVFLWQNIVLSSRKSWFLPTYPVRPDMNFWQGSMACLILHHYIDGLRRIKSSEMKD